LVAREDSISGGTDRSMAVNASLSSQYSMVSSSSGSTVGHRLCAYMLTCINRDHSL
jgi:hypothetical protein